MDKSSIKISEQKIIGQLGINDKELSSNQKEIKYNLYCISCFHKNIWNNKLYCLTSMNPEILSINNVSEEKFFYSQNYIVVIHRINLNEKIKKLNLLLSCESSNKNWNLNEIIIRPSKDKILFV